MKGKYTKQLLTYTLVGCFTTAGMQAQTQASVVSTQDIAHEISIDVKRSELNTILAREDVAKQLAVMGVDPVNAKDRVAALSDAEVAQLHEQMDTLPAGAGAVGTLALVLVILVFLDLAGVTDIFPRI